MQALILTYSLQTHSFTHKETKRLALAAQVSPPKAVTPPGGWVLHLLRMTAAASRVQVVRLWKPLCMTKRGSTYSVAGCWITMHYCSPGTAIPALGRSLAGNSREFANDNGSAAVVKRRH